ncbi:MAG: ion transporter [Acidimicrobiia bacterium]|nr:ion transporter [Acidimicrobiia bacterium]
MSSSTVADGTHEAAMQRATAEPTDVHGDTPAGASDGAAGEADSTAGSANTGRRAATEPAVTTLGERDDADDVDDERTRRERLSDAIDDRLDIPMAVLAVVWAGLVAYELVVVRPPQWALVVGNVIWALFIVEFLVRLVIAGRPIRFLRRHWPSVFFLALPALRVFRVIRAVRAFRALPAARVVGSSYRAIGTARSLLGGRLAFLLVTTAVVIFSGGQLLYLTEGAGAGRQGSFGDALWWSANVAISGNVVFEPETAAGRVISLVLSAYAVVVFASAAATLGAYFVESRAERAAVEEGDTDDGAVGAG